MNVNTKAKCNFNELTFKYNFDRLTLVCLRSVHSPFHELNISLCAGTYKNCILNFLFHKENLKFLSTANVQLQFSIEVNQNLCLVSHSFGI